MVTTFYLFVCALASAQAPTPPPQPAADSGLQPKLTRGMELCYRGTYTEESPGAQVQLVRTYRLESRYFVLNDNPQGLDIACLTVFRGKTTRSETVSEHETSSVRLELGKLDRFGKVTAPTESNWLAPLDGPPTIECGAFVPAPAKVKADQSWETAEEGRPVRVWRVAGTEDAGGGRCTKLVGTQQSPDWDEPRGDRTAWRRVDTVLLNRGGYAHRVERIIERREPGRREVGQRLLLKYELESSLQYPGNLFQDRAKEIAQIQAYADALAPLLPRAAQVGPRPFEAQLAKMKNYVETAPPTPYREAIKHVQRLAEAGRRGESPVTVASDAAPATTQVATVGRLAPDFLAVDLASRTSVRLRKWQGQPVLLLFYDPASDLGEEVLRFGQELQNAHPNELTVVGLSVGSDAPAALKQRDQLKLSLPIVSGSGLRLSYAVDATPKMVLLDGNGIVRGHYIGWGPEIPGSVRDDFGKCGK